MQTGQFDFWKATKSFETEIRVPHLEIRLICSMHYPVLLWQATRC